MQLVSGRDLLNQISLSIYTNKVINHVHLKPSSLVSFLSLSFPPQVPVAPSLSLMEGLL